MLLVIFEELAFSPTNKLPARQVSSVRNVADGNVSKLPNSDPSQQDIPSAVPDVNENEQKLAEKASSQSTEDTWTPSLLSNAPPKSLDGFATSNYFNVLGSVEVDFVKIDVTTKADFGKRYQIVPSKLVVKNDLADSKEASHFMKKNHTRIEKDDRPTRVAEVVDFLIQDLKTAQTPPRPDTLLKEDVHVAKASKHVGFTSNGDSILHFAMDHPIALHGQSPHALCWKLVAYMQTQARDAEEGCNRHEPLISYWQPKATVVEVVGEDEVDAESEADYEAHSDENGDVHSVLWSNVAFSMLIEKLTKLA
ncbi:unnamed protein product [Albugo candida]|uniref:Uncharacterized protein n=1 Tax=Albugo candida TaxID=65357 RepID=A0A024GGT0_9STRA|nr:unnamed protein product [Albugo candida]|eukprot:CCI46097.1 unnamed protein product [Albugo candida]